MRTDKKYDKYTSTLQAAAMIAVLIALFALLPAVLFYQPSGTLYTGNDKVRLGANAAQRTIFVGGAVAREGKYIITPLTTYGDLLSAAGLLPISYGAMYDADRYIDFSADSIIIGFSEQGLKEPINIYGLTDIAPLIALGIDAQTAQTILSSSISRKEQLLDILGQHVYNDIFYKLYCKTTP